MNSKWIKDKHKTGNHTISREEKKKTKKTGSSVFDISPSNAFLDLSLQARETTKNNQMRPIQT